MGKDVDIVVAGGSFVGMAFALASAQAGLRVHLVAAEVLPGPGGDTRASAITAASRRMLERLGVWALLQRDAQPINEMVISDGGLDDGVRPPFLLFDTHGAAADGGPAAWIVENGPMRAALAEMVGRQSLIKVSAPCVVTGFHRGEHHVSVDTDSGPAITAPVLVAADGARSRLRGFAGIKTVSWDYGQWGLAAGIKVSRAHDGKAVQHFLPAGPFAFLPLKGKRGSLVWTERAAQAKRLLALDTAQLHDELHRRLGHEFGDAKLETPLKGYPLTFMMARSFVAARFALVGDAAHRMHPLAGQGFNLGLKDAAALAETLAEARRLGLDIGHLSVLERYQRWRRFDAATLAVVTNALNRLFSNDSAALRAVRDFGLGLVQRLPLLKRGFMREAAGDTGKVPRLLRGEAI